MIYDKGIMMKHYLPDAKRYNDMIYNRCGKSGLLLPAVSLGLWQNFGAEADSAFYTDIITSAFDMGITHFDIANNYGPPPGSAEINFGKVLAGALKGHRDELIISSKAGYYMYEGPYGDGGSKKYLMASLDQSLRRTGLEYFDIFYHHRPDPNTAIEETAHALDLMVRQGKALYVGVSNYTAEQTQKICEIFKDNKTPFIIHQPRYNMLDRWVEDGLTDVLKREGAGMIPFSPLAQGMLSNRYLNGIPADSRAKNSQFLNDQKVNAAIGKVKQLNEVAVKRGQSLAQMAVAWLLNNPAVTSVLVGVSKLSQLKENVAALKNLDFDKAELEAIDNILKQ